MSAIVRPQALRFDPGPLMDFEPVSPRYHRRLGRGQMDEYENQTRELL